MRLGARELPGRRLGHERRPVTGAELRQCATCHLKQKPRDDDHRDVSDRCGNCHYTTKWEPAKERAITRSRSGRSGGGGGMLPSLGGEWWLGGGDDD